jgi:uncharacterized protein (DUF342 family)
MSFTPIETQEQLNEVIGERLRKAEEKAMAKAKEQFADYEDLKKQVTDYQEQLQKLTDTVSESEKKLAEKDAELAESASYRTDLEKTRIAIEAGLKIDYADRLRGETAEEWKADAQALAKDFASSHVAAPLGSNEPKITHEVTAEDKFSEWFKQVTGQEE